MSGAVDVADPREQRFLGLGRLAAARYEVQCALEYLRNSDPGSKVIDDLVGVGDKVDELQRTLEWRQRKDETP